MRWYHMVAYFLGGALLANAVPHFVSGVTGHPFQSPFAHPPGKGLSSAPINVAWGFANLIGAYFFLVKTGDFKPRNLQHAGLAAAGMLAMAMMLALSFGRLYGGLI